MDRASDAPVVASAGTQAEPRTPASWLLSAGRFQTAAPLPVGSDPRSVPRTEPVHIAPLPSSPALGRYAKGLPAAVILLRRNRTDRPLNEGFLLRRLHLLGILAEGVNVAVLVILAICIAASTNFPVLALSLFWRRFNTGG